MISKCYNTIKKYIFEIFLKKNIFKNIFKNYFLKNIYNKYFQYPSVIPKLYHFGILKMLDGFDRKMIWGI